jgi:hypothetical protein
MRYITLKAALAAMIIAAPLSGAFAANGNGATGGNSQGGNGSAYGRGSDGIDSFHRTPLFGMRHYYGSQYNRSHNRPMRNQRTSSPKA